MFDSPFDDWMPGKPTIFGWPWHGRVDLFPGGTEKPRVTLPNGDTFNLDIRPDDPWISEWIQPGNLTRFRDPRAADPERTEDQLTADISRGVEWRAEALSWPKQGIIYGQERGIGSNVWIYHDGQTNWLARYGGQGVTLNSLPLVKRSADDGRFTLYVPFDYRDFANPPPQFTVGYAVIDTTPDGSKALLGRYVMNDPGMPEGSYQDSSTTGRGWRGRPYDFWELTLGFDGTTRTGEMRRIRTQAQVQGTVVPRVVPDLPSKQTYTYIEWSADGGDGNGRYFWDGDLIVTHDPEPVAIYSASGSLEADGSWLVDYGFTGRILGMYYRTDGTIAEVTASLVITDGYTGSLTESHTQTRARIENNVATDPGGFDGILLLQGTATITNTVSRNWTRTATYSLLNDGALVESLEFSATAGGTVDYVTEVAYPTNAFEYFIPSRSGGLDSQNHGVSYTGPLGDSARSTTDDYFGGVGWPAFRTPTLTGPWITGLAPYLAAESSELAYRLSIGSLSYCAQMQALCALDQPALGAAPAAWRIGMGALPYAGGYFEGEKLGSGALTELYGSYNPVTQQYIRDAESPVCWI